MDLDLDNYKPHAFYFHPPLESNFWGHIVAEIYKDGIYEPLLRGKKDLTILDIGANLGFFSYYASQFAKKVYSLEPSLQHFMCLSKMVKNNELSEIIDPVNKALYIKSGRFEFGGPANNRTMRSLHMATWQDGKPDEIVATITLEDLFKEKGIEHVDFMKLDIEGSEVEVLSSQSFKNVADKIDTILMEIHSWSGRHPNQVKEALKNAGFEITGVPNEAEILVAKRK